MVQESLEIVVFRNSLKLQKFEIIYKRSLRKIFCFISFHVCFSCKCLGATLHDTTVFYHLFTQANKTFLACKVKAV